MIRSLENLQMLYDNLNFALSLEAINHDREVMSHSSLVRKVLKFLIIDFSGSTPVRSTFSSSTVSTVFVCHQVIISDEFRTKLCSLREFFMVRD